MNEQSMNDIASKTLGSANSYATFTDKFDPNQINPMPRSAAREDWGITGKEFVGYDVWNCHEATFLTDKGLPVAGTLKFIYSSDSKYMIESKSAKLYLNTFDMCKMGSNINEASTNYIKQIQQDLSERLETVVQVGFFNSIEYNQKILPSFGNMLATDLFRYDVDDIVFDDYSAKTKHLIWLNEYEKQFLYTNVLRSRCRHTKQKDTGSAYVYSDVVGNKVDEKSLLRQIVSLREVNEFHEFCCEKLFCDMKTENQEMFISLLYSRRGSLDINPIRSTSLELIKSLPLLDINHPNEKTQGQ